jgi:hypoxanthine phosphoribosyltransferase
MVKRYQDYYNERDDLFFLAHKIHKEDGFIPDVIYAVMRGGAFVANVISEYYKFQNLSKPIFYAAVCARSYTAIGDGNNAKIQIDGWTYDPSHLRPYDKVMLCDDCFDSGQTINALAKEILNHGVRPQDLKIAVHCYKSGVAAEAQKKHPNMLLPDYYCIDNDSWIVFMSHEAYGLDAKDFEPFNVLKNPELPKILNLK